MHLHARLALRTALAPVRRLMGYDPDLDARMSPRQQLKQDGQVIIIFALMLTVLIGLVGIAVDTTFAWRGALQIQRASDAAALAGVVYMPGSFDPILSTNDATDKALQESTKNGYTDGSGKTKVIVSKAANPRELDVSVTADVRTFFIRLFGIDHITVTRDSKAVYVTPVPMGSPLAYYGVYQMCKVDSSCSPEPTSISPSGNIGVSIASQGFFGAIEGEGSSRGTGDAFATGFNPSAPTLNGQFTPDGYRYEITGGTTAGTVYLYDPAFCATSTKASGHAGAGDHWLGTPVPVSTYFTLWDTLNTPLATNLWQNVAHLYEVNDNQIDKSAAYGGALNTYADGGANPPAGYRDCAADADHNNWVSLGAVAAHETYSLQVTTTDQSNLNANRLAGQTFENMFSIAVSGTGATVHGTGSMVSYANVDSGSQEFYLAQIDRSAGAGKTVEIDLFDPGDVGAASWLQIEPDGTPGWQPTTFNYVSTDAGRAKNNTNCLQTFGGLGGGAPSGCGETDTSGGTFYQNAWVQIFVTLPTNYGDATHPLANQGWWKIKYIVNSGNDTTTWQVSILGNPVHLI